VPLRTSTREAVTALAAARRCAAPGAVAPSPASSSTRPHRRAYPSARHRESHPPGRRPDPAIRPKVPATPNPPRPPDPRQWFYPPRRRRQRQPAPDRRRGLAGGPAGGPGGPARAGRPAAAGWPRRRSGRGSGRRRAARRRSITAAPTSSVPRRCRPPPPGSRRTCANARPRAAARPGGDDLAERHRRLRQGGREPGVDAFLGEESRHHASERVQVVEGEQVVGRGYLPPCSHLARVNGSSSLSSGRRPRRRIQ
jgi:hypothetical protein